MSASHHSSPQGATHPSPLYSSPQSPYASPPTLHSTPPPCSPVANSELTAAPLGLTINIEDFLTNLLGPFELKFFRDGKLTSCGSLFSGTPSDVSTELGFQEQAMVPSNTSASISHLHMPFMDHHTPTASSSHFDKSTIEPSLLSTPSICHSSSPVEPVTPALVSQPSICDAYASTSSPGSPYEHQPGYNHTNENETSEMSDAEVDYMLKSSVFEPSPPPAADDPAMFPRGRGARASLTSRTMFVINMLPIEITSFNEPLIGELWQLISEHRQLDCKALAIATVAALRPRRRITSPYGGKAPAWWPRGIRYVDPSHLLQHERQGLLLYLWLHPSYKTDELLRIRHAKGLHERFSHTNLTKMFQLVLRIRALT